MLVTHTAAQVRLMLAQEAQVPEAFLEQLLTDADVVVALAAETSARVDYPGLVERGAAMPVPAAQQENSQGAHEW